MDAIVAGTVQCWRPSCHHRSVDRRQWLLGAGASFLYAQDGTEPDFVCPMDRDVRSRAPGNCPRCGMKLVPGLPMPVEYPMEFRATPPSIPAGREVIFEFRVLDPKTHRPLNRFETIHERLFHLFIVSQDLEYFSHEHPELTASGWFRLRTRLPKPGTYRLLADFDPSGGTPQLAARTFSTAGFTAPLEASIPLPRRDVAPKQAENLTVQLTTDPASPLAGKKTMLFFHVAPARGLQKYLGAWAHLLSVSSDLIDTVHSHPFIAEGGPSLQFNLFFPRAATYRIWVQLQREGVLNTVAFTIPVTGI